MEEPPMLLPNTPCPHVPRLNVQFVMVHCATCEMQKASAGKAYALAANYLNAIRGLQTVTDQVSSIDIWHWLDSLAKDVQSAMVRLYEYKKGAMASRDEGRIVETRTRPAVDFSLRRTGYE